MLPLDETSEGVKCEELEKIVVDDDSKISFRSISTALLGKGKADSVS